MPEATKKRHIDEEMITLRLRVHRSNAPRIKEYAQTVEAEDKRNYTVAEVFPEYIGKEQQVAIRAYRYRENLTQRQLAELTGIPQRHISEMENGKRVIGKELAKRLAKALNADYKVFL
ncbi:MAG: helix-turn-helix transcriptional regulator [Deltaproteobacteria bacterium]|nr:helix-turn-helix transcriptional regulator [Deltaproteobacteria bacterium]